MIEFLSLYKEIIAILGILAAFFYRGIWMWRQKICFEYKSKKDVAINILRDKIVQRIERLEKSDTEGRKIYQQLAEENFFSNLVRKMNKIDGCFRWLDGSSHCAIISLWISIIVVIIYLVSMWFSWPTSLKLVFGIIFIIALIVFMVVISLMIFIDGRFFRLVNNLIEPEHE